MTVLDLEPLLLKIFQINKTLKLNHLQQLRAYCYQMT